MSDPAAPPPPPSGDPRPAAEAGMLPVVARPRSGPPAWTLLLVAVGIGLVLFAVLDARRRSLSAPAIRPRPADALSTPSQIAPLYVPPVPVPQPPPLPAPFPSPTPTPMPRILPPPAPAYTPQPTYVPQPSPPPAQPARVAAEPTLVIDTTGAERPQAQGEGNAAPAAAGPLAKNSVAGARTAAGVLSNKATTVPQGTLIPAVLETALDSTSPGLARALVSRDIRGFDGTRVLIPRGSRLIGEYGTDTESGQKRMLVNWIRLIRPDGATIAIGSPASDPLGQGGIRARVNSHFFERFAGAILQSALDIGVNLAARAADSPVIVALPGTLGGAARPVTPTQIKPTLKVKAATSISVFVARDLDFTSVEAR
ncbi:conjugal transfer protein TrbI [Sphingomonas sp. CBMAI 2297]|uniref:TrbI/VirB10 family protein n=1 Tax=Sphingomonas sp. CBMAI 2297 TaxID=2991720 RepID=UPI0024566EF0|nr:TrbI/VirB10 family protein [Sphingomonas sp. CBMAI 2297]MDH4744307.1 conjugal transfer protein TrbI [Sphingomonas sp. CBMAI 2297]